MWQYAAILLRTTDLLHVTHDRTPSIQYDQFIFRIQNQSRSGTSKLACFEVRRPSRRLVLDKPETAVIVINADFKEERPLFALQEYVAYADSEIRQSRRWSEKTEATDDGQNYHFPWNRVEGDVRLEGIPPQPLRFELDRGRLLDLLVGHTIYNEPTVAIRELLQNGIDAVRYQHYTANEQPLQRTIPRRLLDKFGFAGIRPNAILRNTRQRNGYGSRHYRTPSNECRIIVLQYTTVRGRQSGLYTYFTIWHWHPHVFHGFGRHRDCYGKEFQGPPSQNDLGQVDVSAART